MIDQWKCECFVIDKWRFKALCCDTSLQDTQYWYFGIKGGYLDFSHLIEKIYISLKFI